MKKLLFLLLIVLNVYVNAYSQSKEYNLGGRIVDKVTDEPLIGANIIVRSEADSAFIKGITTNENGVFRIMGLQPGEYFVTITFIGFKPFTKSIKIEQNNTFLGKISLEQDAKALDAVSVESMQIRTIQRNDTTEINADAYKVNRDASAEDLVAKMPGITVENGQVKAQGEDVRKVLVDGREFFGDDATAALRNLPAEIVDRVQLFDRMSDQAAFTGFNDGNTQKTMNILTRPGMNQGQFGKVYAGGGTDDRYNAGFSINHFNGAHRFSLIGQTNNINQQNFATQDLLGALGSGGVNTRWMGMQNMMRGPGGRGGGRGGWNPMGQLSNFMVNNQGGINATNALGFNYSGKWEKVNLSTSYFANQIRNESEAFTDRTTFLGGNQTQNYLERAIGGNTNLNHRLNVRLEYNIDSNNSIIFTPVLSTQSNKATNLFNGITQNSRNLLNQTISNTNSENSGYNFNGDLLLRHKFAKPRRTFTLNLGAALSDQAGFNRLLSENVFFNTNDSIALIDQNTDVWSLSNNYNLAANYTEPIGKNGMLQLNYNPSVRVSDSERETLHRMLGDTDFSILDSALSNNFENKLITQKAGVSYRYNVEKYNFGVGIDAQYVSLNSDQTFPVSQTVNKPFRNLLPNANLQYKFTKQANIRVFYRTSTNAPSVNQLQNVINNNNPLLLTTGNANLEQSYTHNIFTRFMLSKPEKGSSFFALLNTSITDDFIATGTFVASQDSIIDQGVVLGRGAQLNKPVNLSGNYMIRSFLTWGQPIAKGKFNLNMLAGITFNRTPGLINNAINFSNNTNYNSGFVLASNISKEIDFKITYSANYNVVKNSIQEQLNNNFFSHGAGISGNYLPYKWLVLNSELTQTLFSGLNSDFNQQFLLWNAGIGYKFTKNQMAELRLTAFDLLGQNNSLNRNVTETYVEDNQTQVLTRYFMLTFTYNIRRFKGMGELMQKSLENENTRPKR